MILNYAINVVCLYHLTFLFLVQLAVSPQRSQNVPATGLTFARECEYTQSYHLNKMEAYTGCLVISGYPCIY